MTSLPCPHCPQTCKTPAGLTRHINDIHQEMTPAQKERWEKAQAESLARRTPFRAVIEGMVGKEANA